MNIDHKRLSVRDVLNDV